MKFNRIYESIFKAASAEEVKERKAQGKLEKFKEWVESNLKIKYEDLFKPENINKKDVDGYTALMDASSNGYIDIVKLLLDKGADVNIKNNNGYTALIKASMYGNTEIVELLLNNKADVNIKDKYGDTALIYAINRNFQDIVNLLKQYGAKL